ncbi:MAG: FAD-dependent thymidylate synthase [Gracilibacteraceae bacterium]|jgi:thymidylate synthase (FAD)|nr:FAD-dependent thymidylate synthase [Gracilibacteraceae bacterium]
MEVRLIAFTPEPEKVVAAAARLCYSSGAVPELLSGLEAENSARLVEKLYKMGHLSTFEHASFQFSVDGVSRALSHQLVRHRIASYAQRSQRYVRETGFSFVTPPSVRENPEALRRFQAAMEFLRDGYEALAREVPPEDARYILPNACATSLLVTMNARALLHFFELRACTRAQWEIRELARRMLALAREAAPHLFRLAGPPCETGGVCPEGEMSCKRGKARNQHAEQLSHRET